MSNEKNTEGLNLSKKYASVLVKPTETVIATYGNDYFQNIVATQNFMIFSFILTDKRLYYKGTRFEQVVNQKGSFALGKVLVEENLELKNITKSGFEHFTYFPLNFFACGGTSVVMGLVIMRNSLQIGLTVLVFGIFLLLKFWAEKTLRTFTAIKFDYAGGSLCGNIKLYGEASARDFLKQVKRAQDEYKQ